MAPPRHVSHELSAARWLAQFAARLSHAICCESSLAANCATSLASCSTRALLFLAMHVMCSRASCCACAVAHLARSCSRASCSARPLVYLAATRKCFSACPSPPRRSSDLLAHSLEAEALASQALALLDSSQQSKRHSPPPPPSRKRSGHN